MAEILLEIVAARRRRYEGVGAGDGRTEAAAAAGLIETAFTRALRARAGNAVIAEVKLGSPRLGDLTGRYVPEEQAETYAQNGAAALSVVVEPDFFFGSYDLLRRCQEASGLPTIAKDFVVGDRQLDEAAEAGASALLLIAALYERAELERLVAETRARNIVPLVETHEPSDLEMIAGLELELVGINNRDLRTFDVNLEHSLELAPRVPGSALKVAESGILSRADVERLAAGGFDAFLIGESLVTASDPGARLRELLGE